jgi:type IV pilus assembly protein PilW
MQMKTTGQVLNQKGFTLIELLVSMVISVIVLGGAVYVFSKQNKVFRDENAGTNIRALGRVAMAELTKELRMAGYGFPENTGITAASSTSITYYANTDNITSSITANVSAGASTVVVGSGDGSLFSANDDLVIYSARNQATWEDPTSSNLSVASVSGDTITLNGTTDNAYKASHGIVINTYHTITYNFDGSKITRAIDGGTPQTVVPDVSAFTLTYYDNTGTATTTVGDIQRIDITLTMTDPDVATDATLTFNSDVDIRNS